MGKGILRTKDLNWGELNIETRDLSESEDQIIEEEVTAAISEMPSDKAPDPNNFAWLFFQEVLGHCQR